MTDKVSQNRNYKNPWEWNNGSLSDDNKKGKKMKNLRKITD